METWYQIADFSGRINPIEVERFTDTSIWLKGGRREARISKCYSYFPSREAARAALIQIRKLAVRDAEQRLVWAQENLAKAEAL